MSDDKKLDPLVEAHLRRLDLCLEQSPDLERWRRFVRGLSRGCSFDGEGVVVLDRNFDNMIRHAVDAFFIHDTAGEIIDVNQAACEMLGYARGELLSMNIADVELELDPGAIWEEMSVEEVFTVEGTHLRSDGTTYPAETRVGAFVVEGRKVIVALSRDISERREAKQKLEQLNQQLQQARDEAVRASRTKSAFLANMSHELRTPLNGVIGYAELLIERVQQAGDDDYLDDLERIRTAGRHLLALIDDVLDLTKIEAGKVGLHVRRCRLERLVDEIESTVRPLVEGNDNELIVDIGGEDPAIYTDATKLRQVLVNLLGNAAKFTAAGTVRLGVQRESRSGRVIFVVEDDGIGMSEEELDRVFEAFVQADASTTREHDGTGLGLAITSQYVEMLGGTICAESTKGEGTTVQVELPVDCRETSGDSAQWPGSVVDQDQQDPEPTAVVVADQPGCCELLRQTLVREGWKVVTAADNTGVSRRLEQVDPSVIVVDLLMENTDGWQVFQRLRSDEAVRKLPLVTVLMADGTRRGLAPGPDELLVVEAGVERRRLIEIAGRCGKGKEGEGVGEGEGDMNRCLVVHRDASVSRQIQQVLTDFGWRVDTVDDAQRGIDWIGDGRLDLVVVQLDDPGAGAFALLGGLSDDLVSAGVPVVGTISELSDTSFRRLHQRGAEAVDRWGKGPGEVLAALRGMVPDLES